jgi:two-component system, OmpR family, response regulator MprA
VTPRDAGAAAAVALTPGVLDPGAGPRATRAGVADRLLGRLRARLGRHHVDGVDVLRFGDLSLDPATRTVRRARRPIELTPIEFSLLELFLRNPRRVLTRSLILNDFWGFDFGVMSNSLNVYVGNLRRKTEAAGEPRLIHTVRGVGYVLREP